MAKPQAIIFDFDGTMADTVPLIRNIYAEMATKNNWKELTDADYEMLRRGTLGEARRWSGIRFWQFPALVRSAKKLLILESNKVELFPGIADLIIDLHSQKIDLYVLSRNLPGTVLRVLGRHKLHGKLFILARRKRTLGSKTAVLRALVRRKKYDKQRVWMVGDEVRDVQAAHNSGVNSLAVSWGIQDVSILERYQPTKIAYTVDEMKQILQN